MAYLELRQQQLKGQHVKIPILMPNSLRFALINKHLQCEELPANHADCYAAIDWFRSVPPHHQWEGAAPFINIHFYPPHLYSHPHSYSWVLTEQIKKFGVHFRMSLLEMKRWRTFRGLIDRVRVSLCQTGNHPAKPVWHETSCFYCSVWIKLSPFSSIFSSARLHELNMCFTICASM